MKAKPGELTLLRRRCKALQNSLADEKAVSDDRERQFVQREYALTVKLDESVKALADTAKKAESSAKHEKYMREYSDREQQRYLASAQEWQAYATHLAVQLHVIESVVSGASLASMPEAVAVRLIVEGAKRKECPKDVLTGASQGLLPTFLGAGLIAMAMMGYGAVGLWNASKKTGKSGEAGAKETP